MYRKTQNLIILLITNFLFKKNYIYIKIITLQGEPNNIFLVFYNYFLKLLQNTTSMDNHQ